jgi:hypothetical protein
MTRLLVSVPVSATDLPSDAVGKWGLSAPVGKWGLSAPVGKWGC